MSYEIIIPFAWVTTLIALAPNVYRRIALLHSLRLSAVLSIRSSRLT